MRDSLSAANFDRRFKALVYPAGTVAGYGHVYSLGLAGLQVVALNPERCATFASRFVQERHVVPHAGREPARWIEWLVQYGKQLRDPAVLFVAEDPYAWLVSRHQHALRPFYRYPYIELDRLSTFFDKSRMYPGAVDAGLRVPETLSAPIAREDLDAWPHYPAVLKPIVSRFNATASGSLSLSIFPKTFGAKGLLARSKDDLVRFHRQVDALGIPYCIQRYIPGGDSSRLSVRFVADRNGHVPASFSARKIRQYPAGFGTGVVRRAERSPELENEVRRFVEAVKYCGPGMLDFKQHADEGRWYFMEINVRLDFAVRMATAHGVNLPLQQYLLSTDQSLFSVEQHDDPRHWIDAATDLRGCFVRLFSREHPLDVTSAAAPYWRCREAVANMRDPIPSAARLAKLPFTLGWYAWNAVSKRFAGSGGRR